MHGAGPRSRRFGRSVLVQHIFDALHAVVAAPRAAGAAAPSSSTPRVEDLPGMPPPLYLPADQLAAVDAQLRFQRRRCLLADELRGAALPSKTAGFSWAVERSRAGNTQPGWVSWARGDRIGFDVGATPATGLAVAYLRSYSNVGTAVLSCEGKCKCKPTRVHALDEKQSASEPMMVDLHHWWVHKDPALSCIVWVNNTGATRASVSSNKFKVVALVVEIGDEMIQRAKALSGMLQKGVFI